MGFKKGITSPYNGEELTSCYHTVSKIDWSIETDRIEVALKSYNSKSDNEEGMACVRKAIYTAKASDVIKSSGNALKQVYGWLKDMPEFSGAVDE